jgi:hypothetical protein
LVKLCRVERNKFREGEQFYIQKQPAQILSDFVARKEEVVAFMMLVLISKHKRAISRKLPQFWTKIISRPWPYSRKYFFSFQRHYMT